MRVDLIFSTLPYEAQAIARATRVRIGVADVPFATAEDLIVHKLFAGRLRDLEDVVGVIRRQGDAIDWAYVTRWVGAFAEVAGRERLRTRCVGSARRPTERKTGYRKDGRQDAHL